VAFAVLTKMKFLRGKGIDPFGNTRHRKLERALIPEYMETIDSCLQRLSRDNYENAVEIAALPDMIRGYEEIKEANVERYREAVQNLL
jgi:indolepyruvate ferredoxin oxidoreductase